MFEISLETIALGGKARPQRLGGGHRAWLLPGRLELRKAAGCRWPARVGLNSAAAEYEVMPPDQ
jgi:hypothetical protein